MSDYNVMAVLMDHRSNRAPKVQEVFTKHGCIIKMRLGLHETEDVCSENGLIILQLGGSQKEIKALESDLNSMEGVKAQNMEL